MKFVVEADDHDTRRALARLDLGPPFEIITAPPSGPRTKPKALNVALPFARGSFTVVYDAEDVPEPDQLRRAFATFMAADDRLACVQAALTIDNTTDNWLARMFTADYAGQFDAFLPGLAALRLPFPLGGSSNHFRTAVLRQVGGWDPYNVTEDADLGIRLYRLGYRSAALSSATYEEAPARFLPWLKQRTRWYKGWMQTWLVHMRRPVRLMRELTPAGADRLSAVPGLQRVGGPDPSRLYGRALLVAARCTAAAVRRRHHCRAGVCRDALLRLCLDHRARCGRAAAARTSGARLGAVADAALLVPALARRLACAVPAHSRSAALGEDRARAGQDFAPGRSGAFYGSNGFQR